MTPGGLRDTQTSRKNPNNRRGLRKCGNYVMDFGAQARIVRSIGSATCPAIQTNPGNFCGWRS
jgi:hypothetical protein